MTVSTPGLLTLPRRAWALRHVCAPEAGRYAFHGIYRTAGAYYATTGSLLGCLREPGGPADPVWTARPTKALGKREPDRQVPCGPAPGFYPPVEEVLPTSAHKHQELGGVSVGALRAAVDGARGWRGEPDRALLTWEGRTLLVTRQHPDGAHVGTLSLRVPDVLVDEPMGKDLRPVYLDLALLDRLLRCAEEAVPGCSSPTASLRWPTRDDGPGAAVVLDVGDTLTLLVMPQVGP